MAVLFSPQKPSLFRLPVYARRRSGVQLVLAVTDQDPPRSANAAVIRERAADPQLILPGRTAAPLIQHIHLRSGQNPVVIGSDDFAGVLGAALGWWGGRYPGGAPKSGSPGAQVTGYVPCAARSCASVLPRGSAADNAVSTPQRAADSHRKPITQCGYGQHAELIRVSLQKRVGEKAPQQLQLLEDLVVSYQPDSGKMLPIELERLPLV